MILDTFLNASKLTLIHVILIFGLTGLITAALFLLQRMICISFSKTTGWKGVYLTAWIGTPVHELGHAFAQKWYYKDNSGYDPTGPYATLPYSLVNNNDGFYPSPDEAKLTWRQHPYPCDTTISNPYCGNEDYADMFLGWTYGKWASNEVGMGREKHMNDSMPNWVLFLNEH